jgi:tetratricopeptide (TPR) repeat protein
LRFLFVFILFGLTAIPRLRFEAAEIDKRYLLSAPPPGIKYFSFGFNDAMADSLWLRYVQDTDKCHLRGMEGEGKAACEKGWAYQMLDTITELAPKFRMPYAVGPLTLSVIVDDYDGAGLMFEKAVRAFPNDWSILYRAAYYYLYDKKQNDRAASLLLRAYQNGGPNWLPLLASRLYSKEGQLTLGIATLKAYAEQLQNPKMRRRVELRLVYLNCLLEAQQQGAPDSTCHEQVEKF